MKRTPWRRLTSIETAIRAASAALAAPAVAAAALSPAVLAYLMAYGVAPPQRAVWQPRPPPGTVLHAVYTELLAACYTGVSVPLVTVQRTVLVEGLGALVGAAARARREPGGATIVRGQDWTEAALTLFAASNADALVTTYWPEPWAWVQCWRERGTADPDTLAQAGIGPAERALLGADEEAT